MGGPWGIIGDVFATLWRTRKLEQIAKVTVSLCLTFFLNFCGGVGYQLYHVHASLPQAVGFGLLSATGALYLLWLTSPLLRGTAVAVYKPLLPGPEGQGGDATVPAPSNFQVGERK